jgi:hypothetical protein
MTVTRVEKLEREIDKLSPDELAAFREWFLRYDAEAWGQQIEEDVRAGRLEPLAREAVADYEAGRAREI